MSSDAQPASGLGLSGGRLDDLPRLQGEDGLVLRGAGAQPAAGPGDDEGSTLARAAALRFPSLREIPQPRARVEALVDYISDTAIIRGELEELRLEAETQLLELRARWRSLPMPSNRTAPQVEAARRAADPALGASLDRARWMVDRCSEAIARFGGSDYDAASRAYTLLSGS